MNDSHMVPLTGKELQYIADSISNEELLVKLTSAVYATSQNPSVQQLISSHIQAHEEHLQKLTNALSQHQPLAPQQSH